MPQDAAEDSDCSYLSIGLTVNIDVPRATEDYMLLPYSISDASSNFMHIVGTWRAASLQCAAMSGGGIELIEKGSAGSSLSLSPLKS